MTIAIVLHFSIPGCPICILPPAGHVLSHEERSELIGAACFMHVRREALARQFLNQER